MSATSHVLYEMHLQNPRGAIDASTVLGPGGELLRCVWSNHPDHTLDCRACIPTEAVAEAWSKECRQYGTSEGFFYFSWRGGMWLAYGLCDGRVRGVYCPTHCTERTAHLLRAGRASRPFF